MKQTETFLEFCNELRGYRIFNKKGFEIYKFTLYWNGLKSSQVREKFILRRRRILDRNI